MHAQSFELMKYFVEKYLDKNKKLEILEVGSYDVNGSYKSLFQNPNWNYYGLDIEKGPNVDFVSKSGYEFGVDKEFDIVISGNCLEHVEAPWKWIKEVYKVTKKGGTVCIITPFSLGEHKFPLDCWRILPDGYKYLLEQESNFTVLESKLNIPQAEYTIRPNRRWILNFMPEKIKKNFEFIPTQDTYVIAIKY